MEKIIPNPEKNFAINNSLHLENVIPSSNGIVDAKNGDIRYKSSYSKILRTHVMIEINNIKNTRIPLANPER